MRIDCIGFVFLEKACKTFKRMRAIIQRVVSANVTVDGSVISSIERGLCVLIGLSRDDTSKDLEYIVRKIMNLRLFDGDDGKRWMKSVSDKQYEILCVSQFTLYAVMKGNKPDFHLSMANEKSEDFYQQFLTMLRNKYKPNLVKDGKFGAYMQVHIQNDGPVTITLDSNSLQNQKGPDGSAEPPSTTSASTCDLQTHNREQSNVVPDSDT